MYSETDICELKLELVDGVKNEIIAFLNSKGGTIFVGVNDDGNPVGFHDGKEKDSLDLKIGNWMQDAIYPFPYGLIKTRFNEDGVFVIEIKEGSNKPYYLREKGPKPSGVFLRVGRSKRPANEDEILKMIMESRNFCYEEEISDEQDLTFKYLKNSFEERNIDFTDRVKKTLFIENNNGQYTNLGLLLSDQSPIVVKLAEYDNQMNFKIKKSFSGSLLKVLYELEEQVDRLNDTKAIIDGNSFTRIETKSYPGAALREVILNAICHTDYFIRSNIKIEFFSDKVKITNPGGIFNATMDDIMNGIQTYRNANLVNVFDKLGLIENFGTGIPRTISSYNNYDVKPAFQDSTNYFTVILPNVNYVADQINDQISDQINDPINDLGLKVLKLIKENPGIKVPTLLEKLVVIDSSITADKIRNELKRNLCSYVEYRGSRKTGGYYIKYQ